MEGGSYEIIRNRLRQQADDLRQRLSQLNLLRKEVFGSIESQLIATDRIKTGNYCLARDIVAVGNRCIFAYNVQIGLRSGIQLGDVFSVYSFQGKGFHEENLALLEVEPFRTDFQNLYRYYKDAHFSRFSVRGAYLYMVFQLKADSPDFKAFKWLIADGGLHYVDNRSEHEVRYPEQYEFQWRRATRDDHRKGAHPHVSVLDRVFVETVGGDLTIKVEDNTGDGRGIYREPVEQPDQTLDDAEFFFADLGNLVVLRVKPYLEGDRYFIFNEKLQEVKKVDSLADSGVLLPDGHGLIFAKGYYLQTGEFKIFDLQTAGMRFKKRIASPNGEDFLYAFYEEKKGQYVLLHYNLIEQRVQTPIVCNGFTLFPGGELCYFKREEEPTRHHALQIWQTPFVAGEAAPSGHTDTYMYKVGNKDIVRAMAECQEILTLTGKEDNYANLYDDLVRRTTEVLDGFYWIGQEAAFRLDEPLARIRETAGTAIDEFEKKRRIESATIAEIKRVQDRAALLFDRIKRESFEAIELFVHALGDLRTLRGEITGLKDLQYTQPDRVGQLESEAAENAARLSEDCVRFLLRDEALAPYALRITELEGRLPGVKTARQGKELEQLLDETSRELELLIEVVSNLKIDDATQTTLIVDRITGHFGRLNQVRAALRRHYQELRRGEATAEFGAQLKLLDQSIVSYLDLSDTPVRCDEHLTRLMVQLEELEGKFAEVDSFVKQLAEKREEVFAAFETRKNELIEARNNRTTALLEAGERILEGMRRRTGNLKEVAEINSFFAADLLAEKVRDIIRNLQDLEDSTKAGQLQTRLKSLQEEAVRQLRDKKELFEDGTNIIRLGRHRFAVNVQPLELTMVRRGQDMALHLTGTQFYQTVADPAILDARELWNQPLASENEEVYRAEFLAYDLFRSLPAAVPDEAGLRSLVADAVASRYSEGYIKGVHDEDALSILQNLTRVSAAIGRLRHLPRARALARLWWTVFCGEEQKVFLQNQFTAAGAILRVFPESREFDYLVSDLAGEIGRFAGESRLFPAGLEERAAAYLFEECSEGGLFVVSAEAANMRKEFEAGLRKKKADALFRESLERLGDQPVARYFLVRKWVQAFFEEGKYPEEYLDETATLLFLGKPEEERPTEVAASLSAKGLRGEHPALPGGAYELGYHAFMEKLRRFSEERMPKYHLFQEAKRGLIEQQRRQLRLEEFRAKVLSSFVRNKLIDEVYLPLFGDNLAKQIGADGEAARTDRMGLLLLLSPPGYGKTTLMEYVANQLGLVFVKINGPALGHRTHSLAPSDAPTLAARRELERLNLALEMGDNAMLYIDDIQHCDSEFLQKFISLCDAQRKIEGVFEGEPRTYDLRGRRFAVVMAGNPYTESGTRFQIPDMLANRADVYNLGDIIGERSGTFLLSYVENALTSNPTLRLLANRSLADVYALIRVVETGDREGLELEGNHGPEELAAFESVLGKLLRVRDVVQRVNQAYIQSAAMEDDYRTEPAFRLQGSYRDMNKLAERIEPILNDAELESLIMTHYENESQTLTAHAEANLLKLKDLLGKLSEEEAARWKSIKDTFGRNKRLRAGGGGEDPVVRVIAQLDQFSEGLEGIREAISGKGKKGKQKE